jgi:rhomboid protease GluP
MPRPQPERKTGGLCAACNRLMGIDDACCPHCGAKQTAALRASRAVRSTVPSDVSATQGIAVFLGLLFVLPLVALSGHPDFVAGEYLSRGNTFAAVKMGAMVSGLIDQGQYWRLVTAGYLHFGAMHILFNIYALVVLGRLVEPLYGRGWFLVIYVCTGIAAFVVSYAFHAPHVLSAGASGSITGLLGIGITHCWRHRRGNEDLLQSLLIWAVFIAAFGLFFGADNWAHLGGAVAGALCALVLPAERVGRGRQAQQLGDRLGAASVALVLLSFLMALWG